MRLFLYSLKFLAECVFIYCVGKQFFVWGLWP